MLALDPRGPQFRRQRRERRFIASTITSDLRIVPSNKEMHRTERKREREREKHNFPDNPAEHDIFHMRVLLLIHARGKGPEHEGGQFLEKTPMKLDSTTYTTHGQTTQNNQTDHDSERE